MDIYCIDTSSLIELKEKYPKEIFATLWEKIDELIQKGRIIAPVKVKKEIERGDDELKKWVNDKKRKKMFIKPDENQVKKAKEILKKYPFLAKSEKSEGLDDADPWLIVLAAIKNEEEGMRLFSKNNYIIITEESPVKPNRIPAVCREIKIECINLIEFFKREGWKF